MKVVCTECMKMCCLGGKNSVVKELTSDFCYLEIYTAASIRCSPLTELEGQMFFFVTVTHCHTPPLSKLGC